MPTEGMSGVRGEKCCDLAPSRATNGHESNPDHSAGRLARARWCVHREWIIPWTHELGALFSVAAEARPTAGSARRSLDDDRCTEHGRAGRGDERRRTDLGCAE